MLLTTYMIAETHFIYQAIIPKTSVNKIIHQITFLQRIGELTTSTQDRVRPLWAAVTTSRSSTTTRPVSVTDATAITSIRNVNHRTEEL